MDSLRDQLVWPFSRLQAALNYPITLQTIVPFGTDTAKAHGYHLRGSIWVPYGWLSGVIIPSHGGQSGHLAGCRRRLLGARLPARCSDADVPRLQQGLRNAIRPVEFALTCSTQTRTAFRSCTMEDWTLPKGPANNPSTSEARLILYMFSSPEHNSKSPMGRCRRPYRSVNLVPHRDSRWTKWVTPRTAARLDQRSGSKAVHKIGPKKRPTWASFRID